VPRTPRTPGVQAYFDALRLLFAREAEILSGVLPHYGERGANDELRVRQFLARVLPRKFSLGTGFLVCSDPSAPPSAQTDIVIFDEVNNSPLHRELAADVFPIEIVYGTVEVKGTLDRNDLAGISKDIAKIRSLAAHGWYSEYVSVARDPARPNRSVAVPAEGRLPGPPPRSFVFAFSQRNWKRASSLKKALERTASIGPSHIHGLVVLDRDWYFVQEAYADGGPQFHVVEKNALLHFVRGMLHSLSSMRLRQMAINRYFQEEFDA
jgi:hypothetical protein